MKINELNELNEAGVPRLPAPRGTNLPAVAKPIPTPVTPITPNYGTGVGPGVKPQTTATPKFDIKAYNAAAAQRGNAGRGSPNYGTGVGPGVKPQTTATSNVTGTSQVKSGGTPDIGNVRPGNDIGAGPGAPTAKKSGNLGRNTAAVGTAGAVVGAGLYGLGTGSQTRPTSGATTTPPNAGGSPTKPPESGKPPAGGQGNKPQSNQNYKGSMGSQSLMALNPDKIKDVNKIKAGDSIDLGGGNMYKIQKGDTLDKIAQRMTKPQATEPAPAAPAPAAPAPAAPAPAAPAPAAPVANANTTVNPLAGAKPPSPQPDVTPNVAPVTQAATTTAPVLGTPENPYPNGAPVTSGSGETWRTSDGNAVTTRSDAEIGDTNPRTGVVTPGSFDRNRANGEANMQRLQNLGQGISNFLGFGKKEAPAAATPATQSATTTPSAGTGSPLSGVKTPPASRTFETKWRESTMELNQLRKYSGLSEITESDVTVHKGDYGNKYEPEVVRDQYGHKIGKVSKGAEGKKEAPKRGRGRPTKGDKDEHGNDTKFDTSGLQGMLGGKPKSEVGKKSVKHSLKDWIEVVSDNMINEAEEQVDEGFNFSGAAKAAGKAPHVKPVEIKGTFDRKPNADMKSGETRATADERIRDERAARQGKGQVKQGNFTDMNVNSNTGAYVPHTTDIKTTVDKSVKEGEENKTMSRAAKGHEKYGKEGMQALAKAGRDGASEKKLDTIRTKYDKYDTVEEAKDLPGKQDKLDVAPPKGKLTSADFKALGDKKKKVAEARVTEESEYTYEKVGKILAQENPTLASDSDEFVNAVYQEMIQMGMTPRSAHNKIRNDPDFLGEVVTAYHHYLRHNTVDEGAGAGRGSVNPTRVNPNTPAPSMKPENGMGRIVQGTWQSDPRGTVKAPSGDPEGVKEAGSFIRNLASSRRAFEGKNMKDVQVESWEQDLNSLLNENLTISTTIDDQGHDSVNVSATEGNAHEIIELLRNAGLGGLGNGKQEHGQKVNNYGLPMSGDEHQGPEAQLIAVGDPHVHSEMGDEGGDDMMALIKKMTGIEDSGEEGHEEEGSHDYEEEGSEGHEHDGKCESCGKSSCECDDQSEEVDEAEMEEGNMFTGNLAKAREQGKSHADLDGDGDMEKVDEGHGETCNECGSSMYEGHTCGSNPVVDEGTDEGFANSDDDKAFQDIAYMMRTLSGGGGMGEKRSQATGPIVKIVTAEGTLMKESTDLLSDFRKLSGI